MNFSLYIPKSSVRHSFNSLNGIMTSGVLSNRCYTKPAGTPGAGAGKGGGAGGSIREAGGGLGRFGSAQEEAYFSMKQKEELTKLKKQLKDNPDLFKKKDK